MILSVSRRTDIPAFYAPWFMNRLREGFVLVRNPMNYHQVSRVSLSPDVIDCIVFWSKNPELMLPFLTEIARSFPFYFQFTLNAYGREMEPGLASSEERIGVFRRLADRIGPERVIWRYDPILISEAYPVSWHEDAFGRIAQALQGYATVGVISFVDLYVRVQSHLRDYCTRECTEEEMDRLGRNFSEAAAQNGFQLQTCAERVDLGKYGINHGSCIDAPLIERITGRKLTARKDPNQREECGCVESVDIGQYNTCRHGCRYCYANYNPQSVKTFSARHDPASPFLTGGPEAGDTVKDRKMKSLLTEAGEQLSMDL